MATMITDMKKMVTDYIYDEKNPVGQLLGKAEKKAGLNRNYILAGLTVFVSLYLIFGYAAQVLCNLIGFLYPAYASMRAIETPEPGDDTKWLTYWVVFAFFSIAEYPVEFILTYLPFYFLLKCIFFLWCFMPMFNGSALLYNKFLKPVLLPLGKELTEKVTNVVLGMATKKE